MLNNRDGTNEKPRLKVAPSGQGKGTYNGKNNSTTFKDSRSRYDKGMELYKEGKVKLGANGLFKVSGYYEADTERMTCTCPDYRTRKAPCKHLFAAMLFVKNRGKQRIEHLEGHTNGVETKPIVPLMEPSDKPAEVVEQIPQAPAKPFDRQSTITRLAVLNTATEILKTHGKPITAEALFQIAVQLEKWALGQWSMT